MNAADLMQKNVATVQATDSLELAVASMRERRIGCLVVVGEQSRPLAMLTDRDVCVAAYRTGKTLPEIRVSAAMSTGLFTCRGEDGIADVERIMSLHQVRRLPVIDQDERLVGLISLDDIAREAWREEDWLAHPVSAAAVGVTLGQIARARLQGDAVDVRR